ncbi:hypothetical protein [Rhodopila sp.]|uniref:hypothetical protein n=1 Tax=Rhodopila sp. TaxID=2480087 RepID=UPI003D1192EF
MSTKTAGKGSVLSRASGGLVLLIVGLGCGGMIAVAPDIAAAVLLLLLPGVVGWLLDPTPGKAIGRTMLLFQGAASIHPIVSIWFQCDGLDACVAMAADRRTVLVVLLAAGFGFVLTQILPMALKLLDDGRIRIRRARLVAERQKIVEEWELERSE